MSKETVFNQTINIGHIPVGRDHPPSLLLKSGAIMAATRLWPNA